MTTYHRPFKYESEDFDLMRALVVALRAAEIERVCIRSDCRGRGYCAPTLKLALRALGRAGIPTAYLSGGYDAVIRLYGNLDHAVAVMLRIRPPPPVAPAGRSGP